MNIQGPILFNIFLDNDISFTGKDRLWMALSLGHMFREVRLIIGCRKSSQD